MAAGAIVVALWAAAAILGLVEAPPIVVASGIVAFVVVTIGGLAVARALRRMTQPLDSLIEASGRIEAGDYTARVEVSGSGDMRSLTRAFNQMSAQLQASDEGRRAFLADVSHELRTPLTVIQGQLEAIEDGVYEADAERIAALLAQTRSMTALVEDLRTISLAEVGALELEPRPTDLVGLAEEVVAAFAPAAELAGVRLRSGRGDSPITASIDPDATRRVLGNLVSNAVRHSPAQGDVSVTVGEGRSGFGRVEVADHGPGMEPGSAAKAFERFERGPGSDGSGLGLAIARDLVEAQGGSIELDTKPGAGTHVSVDLPLA